MEHLAKNEANESEMAVSWYLHRFWSWAWLLVLLGVAAGGAAYFLSTRMTPVYRSSTRLLVSAPSTIGGLDPTTGLVTSQTLTSTYAEMLLDRPVLEGVIEQLELEMTPEELKSSITVGIVPNTQLLTVTVEGPDPKRTADIANAIGTVFTARVQSLRSQRYASIRDGLLSQITDMEQQITTTSAKIGVIQQELAAAASQRAAVVGTQLAASVAQTVTAMGSQYGASATQTVTAIDQQVAAAATQIALAAPATIEPAALVQLEEQLTQYRTFYASLLLSYEQVRLAEEQTSTNVVVSESAAVPSEPVGPKKAQYTLLGVLVGMMVAAGVVLAVEKLDDTIKDPEELRSKFGLPILGIIARHQVPDAKPVVLAEPRSLAAEAFRSLRTNITYSATDRPLRRILVTSATPQDGKTTVACSLAAVLSQNEKRVLLIDADLRKPQVHHRFGLQNHAGLTDLFVRPLDDLANVINTINQPKLGVLTSGALPPDPAELLASCLMGKILDALDREYDLIVIDSPPLLTVTDAAALATAMDGVILVARPGVTELAAFKQAVGQLRAVRARLLGVVLNGVDPSSRKYGYYYGHYYSKYSHYYEPSRPGLGLLLRNPLRNKKHGNAARSQSDTQTSGRETAARKSVRARRNRSQSRSR